MIDLDALVSLIVYHLHTNHSLFLSRNNSLHLLITHILNIFPMFFHSLNKASHMHLSLSYLSLSLFSLLSLSPLSPLSLLSPTRTDTIALLRCTRPSTTHTPPSPSSSPTIPKELGRDVITKERTFFICSSASELEGRGREKERERGLRMGLSGYKLPY